jgi:hypothetical protein
VVQIKRSVPDRRCLKKGGFPIRDAMARMRKHRSLAGWLSASKFLAELAGSASWTRHPLFVVFRFSDFGLSDDQAHH